MDSLIKLYKNSGDLHHAYFIIGDKDIVFSSLKNFLEKELGFSFFQNPDFWHGKFNNMTIDEARAVITTSDNKSFSSKRKIFIIEADFITEEAQNAMLKVFEEPTPDTHFFVISPQDILLPTLRSRLSIINTYSNHELDGKESILDLNLKERINSIKKITDAIKDEENTKQDAIKFLNQIELELYKKGVEKNYKALELCQSARKSIYDRGAPLKIILENLLISI